MVNNGVRKKKKHTRWHGRKLGYVFKDIEKYLLFFSVWRGKSNSSEIKKKHLSTCFVCLSVVHGSNAKTRKRKAQEILSPVQQVTA